MSNPSIPNAILLSALLEHISDHVFFKDCDGRYVAVSHSLARRLGCSAAEVIGKTDADFLDPTAAGLFRDREVRIINGGEPLNDHSTRHTWPDGHETWSLSSVAAIRNNEGKVVGLWGTNRNIMNEEPLTDDLRAAQTKNDVLITMSHAIRTPLNGVVGMAGLLLDTRLSASQRELGETIVDSAQALLSLINNMLVLNVDEVTKPVPSEHDKGSAGRFRSTERAARRILLVEDNAVNQKVAQYILARLGYRADAVADGEQAVLAWQRGEYDLILMDCEMPVLDGYQATRRIRSEEAGTRHVPIIALTAHTGMATEAECRAAGMDAFLTKPLMREQLDAQLARFLSVTSVASATSPPRSQ